MKSQPLKEDLLMTSCVHLALNVVKTFKPKNPLVCGYAAVIIKPARGKFVAFLKSKGIGSRGVYGGWEVSYTDVVGLNNDTQSIEIKEAAMNKVAQVLNLNGVNCKVRTYEL